jgi:uncharacterized membrane protein YhaH (DUF805 family)
MRIRRLSSVPFIVGMVLCYAIFFVALYANLPSPLFTIIWIMFLFAAIALIIARLHDAGYSGWWWPLVLVTSLLGLIAIAAVSGAKDENEFGVPPSGRLGDLLTFWRTQKP